MKRFSASVVIEPSIGILGNSTIEAFAGGKSITISMKGASSDSITDKLTHEIRKIV